MRWSFAALGVVSVSLGACGGVSSVSGTASRAFERPGLAALPMHTACPMVVVAGPPRVAQAKFTVKGFAPPSGAAPLIEVAEDRQTLEALEHAVEKQLQKKGFEVVACVSTSSTGTIASAGVPRTATLTLDGLRASTTADVVVVVDEGAWPFQAGHGVA